MFKNNSKNLIISGLFAITLGNNFVLGDEHTDRTASDATTSRKENSFPEYDVLIKRFEELALVASEETVTPELKDKLITVSPSKQQLTEGAEILKRIKWYREQIAATCETSDTSSKLLGEFIDSCISKGVISSAVTEDSKALSINAAKIAECKSEINSYFKEKNKIATDVSGKSFPIDSEINSKLSKLFDFFGSSIEGLKFEMEELSTRMMTEVKKMSHANLCLVEEPKVVVPIITKPVPPKTAVPTQATQAAQPAQPTQQPQVQNPGGYQAPPAGYNGGTYNPGAGKRPYVKDNFKDYGDNNNTPLYIPNMNYPKGSNYQPSNNNFPQANPPQRRGRNCGGGGCGGISQAPIIQRGGFPGGFGLGLGFSNYSYNGGGYPMGYGGYGGMPGYGGGGIGPGYVTPYYPMGISPCPQLINPCGGGCNGGCGGCGTGMGGLITPCGGNNMGFNPFNQFPGRGFFPRVPPFVGPGFNPFFNPINNIPGRIFLPRGPGSPWTPQNPTGPTQPVIPGQPGIPGIPGIPEQPGTPGQPGAPNYNPNTNTVPTAPIRITLPRN